MYTARAGTVRRNISVSETNHRPAERTDDAVRANHTANCYKKLSERSRPHLRRSPTGCHKPLFGSLHPLHTGQIYVWSATRSTFRAVSKRHLVLLLLLSLATPSMGCFVFTRRTMTLSRGRRGGRTQPRFLVADTYFLPLFTEMPGVRIPDGFSSPMAHRAGVGTARLLPYRPGVPGGGAHPGGYYAPSARTRTRLRTRCAKPRRLALCPA